MGTAATQKTPDQAAALIQARVRGLQYRQRQQRLVNGITKLQARQRGRYTRREYQKLLEFYNEQESFLAESKRRQVRLWHREQELYFLQHTTAEQLDAIRAFQHERSARRIQREWKRLHPTPLEDVDISGLGSPFDPFGFASESRSGETTAATRLQPRAEVLKELFGSVPTSTVASQDTEKAARRRAEIQERIQRMRKDADKQVTPTAKPTRRMLYDELVALRLETARQLQESKDVYRKQRSQRDLEGAQLSASCRNRLAYLSDDSRITSLLNAKRPHDDRIAFERNDFKEKTRTWSEDRKRAAWENHIRIVESVLGKSKWYETFIAGEKRDIRRVYARSPWENEKRVWQWPRSDEQNNSPSEPIAGTARGRATAFDRFVFCLGDVDENAPNYQDDDNKVSSIPDPLDDRTASAWWRAHATQSHSNIKQLQEKQLRKMRGNNAGAGSNNRSEDAQVTPEMLVNPVFYELYKRVNETARQKELEAAVAARMSQLEQKIQQKVVEFETQIDINTRLIVEEKNRVLQQKARKTKEEKSATQIQRVMRGNLGRKKAKEHLAEYFVMVRGRAIRKGKCEECGEQPAVLQCNECEESLHFCPVCWVQVHSTRRRKPHVPIPMAVVPVAAKRTDAKVHEQASAVKRTGTRGTQATKRDVSPQPPIRGTMGIVLSSPYPEENHTTGTRESGAHTLDSTSAAWMDHPKASVPMLQLTAKAEAATHPEGTTSDNNATAVMSGYVGECVPEDKGKSERGADGDPDETKVMQIGSRQHHPLKKHRPGNAKTGSSGSRVSLRQRMIAEKEDKIAPTAIVVDSKPLQEASLTTETAAISVTTNDSQNPDTESIAQPVAQAPVTAPNSPQVTLDQNDAARKIQALRRRQISKQKQEASPNPKE